MTQTQQKSLAILRLNRGKIFDTSEIKHSQEHVLYTVIKVLRSSILVQGVLLARLTADTVGQRAQLSPWVTLNRNVSADHQCCPLDSFSACRNYKVHRLCWNQHVHSRTQRTKGCTLLQSVTVIWPSQPIAHLCSGWLRIWYILSWITLFVALWG